MKRAFPSFSVLLLTLAAAAQSNVTTTGGTTGTIPKFSGSTTVIDSALSETNGNLQIGDNSYLRGAGATYDGGYINFTSGCCSIDGTHGGYGTWANFNGFFNGSNWIQTYGQLDTYMYTTNWHAGGWAWYHSAATGTNGGTFTPSKVAGLDANGNFTTLDNAYLRGGTAPYLGGYVNFASGCCSIDATHDGYGAWLNYNGYFNGSNWIQPYGELQTYMFTTNYHAGGWGWYTAAPTGTNGASFTPVQVASMDASGDMNVNGTLKTGGGVIFPDGSSETSAPNIRHGRTTNSCTTSQNIGSECSITVSWTGAAFPDTNYSVTCTQEGPQPANYASSRIFVPLAGRTTTGVLVTIETLNSLSAVLAGVDCIAVHD